VHDCLEMNSFGTNQQAIFLSGKCDGIQDMAHSCTAVQCDVPASRPGPTCVLAKMTHTMLVSVDKAYFSFVARCKYSLQQLLLVGMGLRNGSMYFIRAKPFSKNPENSAVAQQGWHHPPKSFIH